MQFCLRMTWSLGSRWDLARVRVVRRQRAWTKFKNTPTFKGRMQRKTRGGQGIGRLERGAMEKSRQGEGIREKVTCWDCRWRVITPTHPALWATRGSVTLIRICPWKVKTARAFPSQQEDDSLHLSRSTLTLTGLPPRRQRVHPGKLWGKNICIF